MDKEIETNKMQIIPVKPEEELNENIKLRPSSLRGTPFCWQDVRVMRIIRENYNKKRRTTAIAIYQTLTELASISGRGQGKHVNQFTAYLGTIAGRVGKSESTIKRYAKEFNQLKILSWENRKKGKMNLSNMWKLLTCPIQNNKSTSNQNKELNPLDQNNELDKEEYIRKYINNKGEFKGLKNNNGFMSLKDIISRK